MKNSAPHLLHLKNLFYKALEIRQSNIREKTTNYEETCADLNRSLEIEPIIQVHSQVGNNILYDMKK